MAGKDINSKQSQTLRRNVGERFSGVVGGGARGAAPEWRQVSPTTLSLAVACIQAVGGAIMFGCTTDGGALSLTVFLGDARHKFYFKNSEEAADGLAEISRDLAEELQPAVVRALFGGDV